MRYKVITRSFISYFLFFSRPWINFFNTLKASADFQRFGYGSLLCIKVGDGVNFQCTKSCHLIFIRKLSKLTTAFGR